MSRGPFMLCTTAVLLLTSGRAQDASFDKEYDFVVVGGGCAGAVVASRLSEEPQWSVLLLEAGGDETFIADVPLMASFLVHTDYNWGYETEPSDAYCTGVRRQRCKWPQGKALGGSSVINYMVYTRGTPDDYDEWERLGNRGWSYDHVLPYFLKSENNLVQELETSPYHARGGYLDVRHPPWQSPLAESFLAAGREAGFNVTDPNGKDDLGFSLVQATMRDGSRLSAARAFLHPAYGRSNLRVAKYSVATKILVDPRTNTAIGVEFVKNKKHFVVKASKEVILSAGSLNSPKLLMLSGIGPRDHLEELNIPVTQDLKVGFNLQDHVTLPGLTFLVNSSVTIVEGRFLVNPTYTLDYLLNRRGPLTNPGGAEVIGFVNVGGGTTRNVELVFGPGALSGDLSGSLRRALGLTDDFYRRVFWPILGRDAWGIVPVLLKPHSRGRVKLRSADPSQTPLLHANYYQDERDLLTLVEGIKMAVKLGESPSMQRYNSTLHRVPFPGCEQHPFGSDLYWTCAVRLVGSNLHHQVGTCKMGPSSDPDAVVDPELRVRGVRRLRVVDASVMPVVPAAHTMAPTYMLAEKGADLIKQTWLRPTT